MDQEFLGGLVQNRPSKNFFSATGSDQFLVEQGLDNPGGLYAANLLYLRNRHWLLVGNDRKSFERSQGKPGWRRLRLKECTQGFVMLRFRGKAESSRNLADLNAMLGLAVLFGQCRDAGFDFCRIHIRQRLPYGIKANGFLGQVNDCLKQGGKIGIAHNLDLRGRRSLPWGDPAAERWPLIELVPAEPGML